MCYASRTGTRRNLQAMRAAGWGLLCCPTPRSARRTEGFDRVVIDNGKWRCFTTGEPWDEAAFVSLVDELGALADFVIAPDVVADGTASLALTRSWVPRLHGKTRQLLVAVQDGMRPADVVDLIGPNVGIFLGGSTEWKLATMALWGAFSAERRVHYHVARVNTVRRIRMAHAAGAHSIDGSSGSRFAETVPLLQRAIQQPDLLSPRAA
jgi:hypothetical protein